MRHNNSLFFVAVFALTLSPAPLLAEDTNASVSPSITQFAISSISVDGTNLVLKAIIPPALQGVILETLPAPGGSWEEAGILDVQAGVGEVTFTIPKPSAPTAFFRLKASGSLDPVPLISSELQYVTMPSLGSSPADNGDAIFHFKGTVDGSDRIVITRDGALWTHVNWDWPQEPVTINGTRWNPKEKNYLTTVGGSKLLPKSFSLESASLETIQGRDVVALERAGNALIVYLDDTPLGADTYEIKIRFHPTAGKWGAATASARATVKIAAQIDGSDCIKLTATEALWEHGRWSYPGRVTLNGVPWDPQLEPVRKNEGTNRFLPSGIDFSTARIVSRKGRDLATMWSDKDAVWIRFADNPNADDAYELEISFGL